MSWLDQETEPTFAWVRAAAVVVAMGGVAALFAGQWLGLVALFGAGALWWGAR